MCCLNVIADTALETGPLHDAGAISTRNASGSENAPFSRCPGSDTESVASAPVDVTVAVVVAVYSRSTPGANVPNDAPAPSMSESVAGTVPPTPTAGCTPGEPTSLPALKAPLTPTALSWLTAAAPAALSNVKPVVEAPKLTPVTRRPNESNRFTASPSVLSPTPEPL